MNLKVDVMKLVLFILCFSVFGVYGQWQTWCFDEEENEDGLCMVSLYTGYSDTIRLEIEQDGNNLWQIGPPKKSTLDSAYSYPNVIITDTSDVYPIDDTSAFSLWISVADFFNQIGNIISVEMSFNYAVDADSLSDYGLIEFSPNTGEDWYNLLDEQYDNNWQNKPTLTGLSYGWQSTSVEMFDPVVTSGASWSDTLIWRFTFISNDVQNNRDGLMFDDIQMSIGFTNLEEHENSPKKEVVKVLDLLGRETQVEPNRVLIYVYSDGTREKKMVSDW